MENQERREIDLIDILQSCFNFIRSIILKLRNFLIWLIRFFYKEKWILLCAIVFGLLLSLYWSREENSKYKAEVELRFNIHDSYFYKNLINILRSYSENEKNKDALVDALKISPQEASKILSINSFFYIDVLSNETPDEVDYDEKFSAQDTLNSRMTDRLQLVALAKDTTVFPVLLKGIQYFFSNNPVLLAENQVRMRQIDEKIDAINNEIHLLDSLRKIEYFRKDPMSKMQIDKTVLFNEKEKKLYHTDILNLESQKQNLQWEKEIKFDGVRFVSDFKVKNIPENSFKKSALRIVPLFFLLGFCVALFWNYRKQIHSFLIK